MVPALHKRRKLHKKLKITVMGKKNTNPLVRKTLIKSKQGVQNTENLTARTRDVREQLKSSKRRIRKGCNDFLTPKQRTYPMT